MPGGRLLRLAGDGWSAAADDDGGGGGGSGFRCCWDGGADGEDEEVEEEANIWWWLLTISAISVRKAALPCLLYRSNLTTDYTTCIYVSLTTTLQPLALLASFPSLLFLLLSGIEVPREALWGGKAKLLLHCCLYCVRVCVCCVERFGGMGGIIYREEEIGAVKERALSISLCFCALPACIGVWVCPLF